MLPNAFRALVVEEKASQPYARRIAERTIDGLPAGDVLVRVAYSSLNYKDAISATGNRGVTRNYPHTPGIDAAGIVAESVSDAFRQGDPVIVTGYDLGMNTAGGFGQYIRIPSGWAVPLPEGLSLRESMAYGTAGLTAALSIIALIGHGLTPGQGEILVSGATGGVVACRGNASSSDLAINVYPFILRGVRLIGIDSQHCPVPMRRRAWANIAGPWKIYRPETIVDEISLSDIDAAIDRMLSRRHTGRTVVRLWD